MSGQLEVPFKCLYHLSLQVPLSQDKGALHLDYYSSSFVILSLQALKFSEERVEWFILVWTEDNKNEQDLWPPRGWSKRDNAMVLGSGWGAGVSFFPKEILSFVYHSEYQVPYNRNNYLITVRISDSQPWLRIRTTLEALRQYRWLGATSRDTDLIVPKCFSGISIFRLFSDSNEHTGLQSTGRNE